MSTSNTHPVALGPQVVHAGQRGQAVRRPGQLGLDRWCGSGGAARSSVPVSTVRPSRMMVIRSQSASTSARMWLDSSTVRSPRRFSSRMTSRNTSSISGSRPEVGSSRISSSTSEASAATSADLLPVALGVGAALLARVELEALQQLVAALAVESAAQPAEQVDHLAAGEVRPQRDVARHVREPPVQRGGVAPRVAAEQRARCPPSARISPSRIRMVVVFPAPFGPEEAVHLPGAYLQVEPVQSDGRGRTA